jgi:hypothetical protein
MRARSELGRTHAPSGSVQADANLLQIWVRDTSGRTRRLGCVALLKHAKPTRQSNRTRSNACGRDASARWRCP